MTTLPKKYQGRYFYHCTHLKNLDSILEHGLLSTNQKDKARLTHTNIANLDIQSRRHEMKVPCEPKGNVHDYVPFYFCSLNPMMLGVINKKNVDQNLMIFLAVPFERLLKKGAVFTDTAANAAIPPTFYNNIDGLDELNWNAINSIKWGSPNNTLNHRMAEVLIYDRLGVEEIDTVYVWNEAAKKKVEEVYGRRKIKHPKIEFEPRDRRLYYTKFYLQGREGETLVTGPSILRNSFTRLIQEIIEERKTIQKKYKFETIEDAIDKIDSNFSVISELDDIFELPTDNQEHSENVSDHTLKVVEMTINSRYYSSVDAGKKDILKFSAYLHDIGKGPKSKWKDGIQKAYPDHPVDAIPMLRRILVEDIKILTDEQIRLVCLLVVYHDLIGEIIGKGRDKEQLHRIIKTEVEFDMLNCLNLADVSAINRIWAMKYNTGINEIKQELLKALKSND